MLSRSAKNILFNRKLPFLTRRFIQNESKIMESLSDLNMKHNITFKNMPLAVLIGPQSTGKSSIVESICNTDNLLPKKMDMATKKPTYFTTIRSEESKYVVNGKNYVNQDDANQEILRLNENSYVNGIHVKVYDSSVYHSSFVDLPGLFYVSSGDKNMPKKVMRMTEDFLKTDNTIPMIVSSATQDPATNQALQLVFEHDRSDDSIGIISKLDLADGQRKDHIMGMLNGDKYQLGHGWTGGVFRNGDEVSAGMSIKEKEELETVFLSTRPYKNCGLNEIKSRLSKIQLERIRDSIPNIISEINDSICKLELSNKAFKDIEKNSKSGFAHRVANILEMLYNQSLDKAIFEKSLKSKFNEEIMKIVTKSDKKFDVNHSKKRIHPSVISKLVCDDIHYNKFDDVNTKELWGYGVISPHVINQNAIHDAWKNDCSLGTTMSTFNFKHDDPLGKKLMTWHNELKGNIADILEGNIIDIIYDITSKSIIEYLVNHPDNRDAMATQFAEYMVNKVGKDVFEDKIRYSIKALVNTQKRPNVNLYELTKQMSKMYSHPTIHIGWFDNSLSSVKNDHMIEIDVYGEAFRDAYMKCMANDLSSDIYRNVAVNLLDEMVIKMIEFAFDLNNKEEIMRQQEQITDKINDLREIRDTLSEFHVDTKKQKKHMIKPVKISPNYMNKPVYEPWQDNDTVEEDTKPVKKRRRRRKSKSAESVE